MLAVDAESGAGSRSKRSRKRWSYTGSSEPGPLTESGSQSCSSTFFRAIRHNSLSDTVLTCSGKATSSCSLSITIRSISSRMSLESRASDSLGNASFRLVMTVLDLIMADTSLRSRRKIPVVSVGADTRVCPHLGARAGARRTGSHGQDEALYGSLKLIWIPPISKRIGMRQWITRVSRRELPPNAHVVPANVRKEQNNIMVSLVLLTRYQTKLAASTIRWETYAADYGASRLRQFRLYGRSAEAVSKF